MNDGSGDRASRGAAPGGGFGRGWVPVSRDIGLPEDKVLPVPGRNFCAVGRNMF